MASAADDAAKAASHLCPACAKPVDALRAGRVAFVDARFLYFCDASCKAAYFSDPVSRASAPAISTEIATAEPPPVALRVSDAEVAESSPVPTHEPEREPEPEFTPPPPVTLRALQVDVAPADEPPRSIPLRPWSTAATTESEALPPSTTRGRAQRPSPLPELVLVVGVACGLLSLGAALLGSGVAVRLVLATIATVAATAQAVLLPGDPGRARVLHAGPRLVPLFGELVVAVHARWSGESGGAYLVAAGVGAAVMLIVERVLARGKEQLAARRERISGALRGTATMADGTHLAADGVHAGDVFVSAEGSVVPADGVVTSGEAMVSPHVGASVDVPKRDGDVVVAGARVHAGVLRVNATFGGADRAYARALSERGRPDLGAPLVRLALRGAREGGLVVFALVALATYGTGASLWSAFGNGFAAVLALGAAAAFGAASVEHARAHLRALEHGIVYRDPDVFELAGTVSRAVVCARGTLLLGEPEILAVETFGGASETDVLAIAASIAAGWTHPFGVALRHVAESRGVRALTIRSVIHQGSGAVAVDSAGARVVLGRRPFLLSERISVAVADAGITAHEEQGRSVVVIARGDRVIGIVAMQDGLRSGARAAIQRLHDADIEPVLLSGESRETCEMLGRSLDIDNLRPDVARGERAQAVRSLAEGGDVVAALGTPALDEEALSAADVAVALGAAGQAGVDPAISLASADVRDAVLALVLPRIARERSRTALGIGLAPGVVFAFALSFGLLSPAMSPIVFLLGASLAILYAKE